MKKEGIREIWAILGKLGQAKLSQAKSFFIHIFLLNNGKRGRKGIFGQFWAVLGKLGQVWIRQQISKMGKKGRKNKKREQKFEWYSSDLL